MKGIAEDGVVITAPNLPPSKQLRSTGPHSIRVLSSKYSRALQLLDEGVGKSNPGNHKHPFTFPSNPTNYKEKYIAIMEYKRQYRDLPDEVRKKISASTKGKAKTYSHKEHIRQGMLKYWSGVSYKDQSHENNEVEPLNTDGGM
ncbi:MAG: hypothetical protein II851_01940 [Bacteroidales bacterium]|nr:hypothetical protein [Bacteroidales bacterium]